MRLRELRIRNIASLRGEHTVDFRDIESRSHLFAITGETGAGKSSLLNSIGLALYGKVFKSNVIQNDLVTLGERDGEIQLLFEVKGRSYLASWHAKVLKANGEPYAAPQSPTRELYELEAPSFSAEKHISTTKVEELLNLDFDQFCKCIILNQGEFARFLLSTFNERKEILEKLYPGEVLESVSRELKADLDAVSEERLQIQAALGALTVDGEGPENLEKDLKAATAQLETTQLASDQLKKIASAFLSAKTYHQNHGDYRLKKEQIEAEVKQETVGFNEVLKQNEAASLRLQSSRQRLKSEEPRLLTLLESELKLRHAEDSLGKLTREKDALSGNLKKKQSTLEETRSKVRDHEEKITASAKTFPMDLDAVMALKDHFTSILEIAKEREHLRSEGDLRNHQFKEIEAKGKELSAEIKSLEDKVASYPEDLASVLENLLKEKARAQASREARQRSELEIQKISETVADLLQEAEGREKNQKRLETELRDAEEALGPLRTTLKLQEVLMAVKTCLFHPESEKKGACPVCSSAVTEERWRELKTVAQENDFDVITQKARDLEAKRIALLEEKKHLDALGKKAELQLLELRSKEKALAEALRDSPQPESSFEEKIAQLQKDSWECEKTKKELLARSTEREEIRKKYRDLREILNRHQERQQKNAAEVERLSELLLPWGLGPLEDALVEKIRRSSQLLPAHVNLGRTLEALAQEEKLITQALHQLLSEDEKLSTLQKDLTQTVTEISGLLKREVGEAKVSELLEGLRSQCSKDQDLFDKLEQDLKAAQSRLKDLQGRIFSYDEQMKVAETMFNSQLVAVREEGLKAESFDEEKRDFLRKLSGTSVCLSDPPELLTPVADRLSEIDSELRGRATELSGKISSLETLKSETEKRLDRIKLLQLKTQDLTERFHRLQRLSEVLGRDELRSFVLSMVEENLIRQTNLELQRLCQARYEIIHQNRGKGLNPDFYILDKFREGQRRKVSTLSGGETFMVSLAMALGLAEMTRGQAEIDSLFIDEGFGTLDEESLEDVMEMLGQIQTRGLLVGVISHVKALTRSMPVNLNLSKRPDGTSTIGLRIN